MNLALLAFGGKREPAKPARPPALKLQGYGSSRLDAVLLRANPLMNAA